MYLNHFADIQITKKNKLKPDKHVSAHQILSGSILFMLNKGIFLNLRSILELRRSPGRGHQSMKERRNIQRITSLTDSNALKAKTWQTAT